MGNFANLNTNNGFNLDNSFFNDPLPQYIGWINNSASDNCFLVSEFRPRISDSCQEGQGRTLELEEAEKADLGGIEKAPSPTQPSLPTPAAGSVLESLRERLSELGRILPLSVLTFTDTRSSSTTALDRRREKRSAFESPFFG